MLLAKAFLLAYSQHAPLTSLERTHFVAFLRWSLLAIAYWRWQNFNIRFPTGPDGKLNPRRDAYLPMQLRVEALELPQLQQELRAILEEAKR
jgi:Ser/Thr protein kinase RdoA (MazF antagonist)